MTVIKAVTYIGYEARQRKYIKNDPDHVSLLSGASSTPNDLSLYSCCLGIKAMHVLYYIH